MLTIIVFSAIYFYANYLISNTDFTGEGSQKTEQCITPDSDERHSFDAKIDGVIQKRTKDTRVKVSDVIDKEMILIYQKAEQGTDEYLDWFYSVTGEYQRLALAFSGDVAIIMGNEINRRIFKNSGVIEGLDSLSLNSFNQVNLEMDVLADEIDVVVEIASNNCGLGGIGLPDGVAMRDSGKAGTAMASGAVAARLAGKSVGKKAASIAVAKIAQKGGFKLAVNLVGKAITKKAVGTVAGGAVTGAAAGLVCGPAAPACSLVGGFLGGLVTWIAIDVVVMEIDESINRDQFRQEILSVVTAQLRESELYMKDKIKSRIKIASKIIREAATPFIPARDGVGQ